MPVGGMIPITPMSSGTPSPPPTSIFIGQNPNAPKQTPLFYDRITASKLSTIAEESWEKIAQFNYYPTERIYVVIYDQDVVEGNGFAIAELTGRDLPLTGARFSDNGVG